MGFVSFYFHSNHGRIMGRMSAPLITTSDKQMSVVQLMKVQAPNEEIPSFPTLSSVLCPPTALTAGLLSSCFLPSDHSVLRGAAACKARRTETMRVKGVPGKPVSQSTQLQRPGGSPSAAPDLYGPRKRRRVRIIVVNVNLTN